MTDRPENQRRLLRIAQQVDPDATILHDFDASAFIVGAPGRRDVPLAENFVADKPDRDVEREIRRRWGLDSR